MKSVSCVDNRTREPGRQKFGSTRTGMPDDDDVALHGLDVPGRIQQCLALDRAACGRRNIDDIRGKTLTRQLKGCSRPRACFVKQVDYGLPAKGGDFLDVTFGNVLESSAVSRIRLISSAVMPRMERRSFVRRDIYKVLIKNFFAADSPGLTRM